MMKTVFQKEEESVKVNTALHTDINFLIPFNYTYLKVHNRDKNRIYVVKLGVKVKDHSKPKQTEVKLKIWHERKQMV